MLKKPRTMTGSDLEVLVNAPIAFSNGSYSSLILERLGIQKELKNFCDVILQAVDQNYPAHRNVLAACSPYFESVLARTENASEHIVINCGDHRIFEAVLNYMYSGKITIDKDNVAEILRLANFLVISTLKNHCVEFLQEGLRTSNCFYIRDLADSNGLSVLLKTVEAFIFANVLEIINNDDVLEVSESKLDFLISRSMPLTEIQRVKLICRWTEHHLAERKSRFPALLTHILWQRVGALELCHFLRDTALLTDNEFCMYHALQSLKDSCLLPDIYFDSLNTLHSKLICPVHILDKAEFVVEDNAETALVDHGDAENNWDKTSVDSDGTIFLDTGDNFVSQQALPSEEAEEKFDTKVPSEHLKPKTILQNRNKKKPKQSQTDEHLSDLKLKYDKTKVPWRLQKSKRGNDENAFDPDDDSASQMEKKLKMPASSSFEKRFKNKTGKPKCKRKPRGCPRFTCDLCPFSTLNPDKLKIHTNAAHRDGSKFACTTCSFSCNWNREYYQHMKMHYPGPPHLCDRCGFSADRVQVLLVHQMDHTDERPYECKTCGMKFKMKSNLVAHSRCHSGEKPFVCPMCDRSFATKGTMEQHMVTHSNQRPYLCDLCGFSTKYHSHLIAHKRLHTGDVFKCQFMNCEYSTPKRSQLACHMRCHMRIRSHTCTTCGKSFVEKSHLVRHERVHLEDKPFKCDFCDYSSTRRDKLKEHQARYHDETSTVHMAYRPRKPKLQESNQGASKAKETRTVKVAKSSALPKTKTDRSLKIRETVKDVSSGKSSIRHNLDGLKKQSQNSEPGVGILLEAAVAAGPQNTGTYEQNSLMSHTYATLGLVPLPTNGFAAQQINTIFPVQSNSVSHDLLNINSKGQMSIICSSDFISNGNVSIGLDCGNRQANQQVNGLSSSSGSGQLNGHVDLLTQNHPSGSVEHLNGVSIGIEQTPNVGSISDDKLLSTPISLFSSAQVNGGLCSTSNGQVHDISLLAVHPRSSADDHSEIISLSNVGSCLVPVVPVTNAASASVNESACTISNGGLMSHRNGHKS